MSHQYQNTSIQGCQIRHYEDPQQVFSDNKDMEESIMTMKNIFLLWVPIMTNLTSLDAGVLILVRHMLLNMFFMVMLDSSMLVMSLSVASVLKLEYEDEGLWIENLMLDTLAGEQNQII